MTHEEYAAIQAMNWSTLKDMAVSGKMYQWRRSHPRKDTPALRLGRAIHCAALEPNEFTKRYIVRPDFGDGRTKAAKEAKAAWEAERPQSAEVIEPKDYDVIRFGGDSLAAHGPAMAELQGAHEVPMQWTDPETGIRCKSRLDLLNNTVNDLKSTRGGLDQRSIHRACIDYLYHGQLAWYHDGAIESSELATDADYPRLIFVQTVEPYDVAVYFMTPADKEAGTTLWRRLLDKFRTCDAAGVWPGAVPAPMPLDLPLYAPGGFKDEIEEEDPFAEDAAE